MALNLSARTFGLGYGAGGFAAVDLLLMGRLFLLMLLGGFAVTAAEELVPILVFKVVPELIIVLNLLGFLLRCSFRLSLRLAFGLTLRPALRLFLNPSLRLACWLLLTALLGACLGHLNMNLTAFVVYAIHTDDYLLGKLLGALKE